MQKRKFYSYEQPFLLDRFGPASDGSYPLIPVEFFSSFLSSQGSNRWGAFDGVYWIPGLQRASGDVIENDTDNFRGIVFNGAFRVSVRDFFVIETGV